jgi:hypothetical protein
MDLLGSVFLGVLLFAVGGQFVVALIVFGFMFFAFVTQLFTGLRSLLFKRMKPIIAE